ncbi:MAG: hypothetical protein INR62_08110 [Rhodospirillales bacterium]|nr:hypothetical protein [Acetobacter sp.]
MGWKEIAATKQQQIWAQAPAEWRAATGGAIPGQIEDQPVHHLVREGLTPSQQQVTEWHGMELLQALSRGDITAVEALTAFMRRAMLAHSHASPFQHLSEK